jgi:hypothetical protein
MKMKNEECMHSGKIYWVQETDKSNDDLEPVVYCLYCQKLIKVKFDD